MTLLQKLKRNLYVIEGTLKDAGIDIENILSIESCDMLGTSVHLSNKAEKEFDRLAESREVEVYESDYLNSYTLKINGINIKILKEKATADTVTKERTDT